MACRHQQEGWRGLGGYEGIIGSMSAMSLWFCVIIRSLACLICCRLGTGWFEISRLVPILCVCHPSISVPPRQLEGIECTCLLLFLSKVVLSQVLYMSSHCYYHRFIVFSQNVFFMFYPTPYFQLYCCVKHILIINRSKSDRLYFMTYSVIFKIRHDAWNCSIQSYWPNKNTFF